MPSKGYAYWRLLVPDCIFGDSLPVNSVHTPYINGSGQPYSFAWHLQPAQPKCNRTTVSYHQTRSTVNAVLFNFRGTSSQLNQIVTGRQSLTIRQGARHKEQHKEQHEEQHKEQHEQHEEQHKEQHEQHKEQHKEQHEQHKEQHDTRSSTRSSTSSTRSSTSSTRSSTSSTRSSTTQGAAQGAARQSLTIRQGAQSMRCSSMRDVSRAKRDTKAVTCVLCATFGLQLGIL